jgi:hypothetical protein
MLSILEREPLIRKMKWFMHRGVPGQHLDIIVNGLVTAFDKNYPWLGHYLTYRFFDILRMHPLIREPDSRCHPRHGVIPVMQELLNPLAGTMAEITGPVERNSLDVTKIQVAVRDFAGRVSRSCEITRDHATTFRIIWGIGVTRHKLGTLDM